MRSLLRASTVTHLRIFLLQTVTAGMAENTRGDIVEMSRYIFYIFMQGYCLLHRPSQGSVGTTREGDDGNERRAQAFSPLLITAFVPSRFPEKINSKYPPKIDRERLRTRLQIFFLIFFKKRRCLHAQVHKSSAGVFFGRANLLAP